MKQNKTTASDNRNALTKPIKLSDVVGQEDAVQQLKEFIFSIENKHIANIWKVKPPKGLLLTGVPGTGKTMSVRALVNEIQGDVILEELKFKDLESQWVGKSVKLLSTYFAKINAEAKKNHVIVFIDEIDAFLPVRDSKLHQSFSQRVTVFLEWMDGGIYPLENVTLIGTTNCLNNLDPAAKRPGRFDRIIEFKPLNSEAIVDCFKVHLDLKQLEENQIGEIDWDRIKSAVANVQLSGAAIPNILDRILIEKAIEHSNKISASTEKAKKINPNDISFYPTPISTEDLLSQITIFLKSSQE